jgi:hypothetical protein
LPSGRVAQASPLPGQTLAGPPYLPETLRLEPLELPGDGDADDLGEVSVRDLVPQERLEPLQLVPQRTVEVEPKAGAIRGDDLGGSRRPRRREESNGVWTEFGDWLGHATATSWVRGDTAGTEFAP